MDNSSITLSEFAVHFPVVDGSYRLKCDAYYVDVLYQSNGSYSESEYVVVSLEGAVAKRKQKKPPFYCCMGLSKSVNLPLLSISDPSLNLSDEFSLGWYAGNEKQRNLPFELADFFDRLITNTGKKLLFVGGSGGGFAILSIHALMQDVDNSVAIVWNPQTSIIDYSLGHASRYLNVAFKNFKDWNDGDRESIYKFLKNNVRSQIYRNSNKKTILFMDGYDHNHLRLHLRPWLNNEKLIKKDGNCLIFQNLIVYIGDWGSGHTPPPKKHLIYAIEKVIKNKFFDTLWYFNSECRKPLLNINDKSCFETLENITARVNCFGIGVNISCNVNELFVGYQIAINVLESSSGKVLARSGWLKNYHACQCYFTCDNLPSSLSDLTYQICIYDFFGAKYISNNSYKNKLIFNYPLLTGKVNTES